MEVLQRTANRGSISTGYDIDNSCKFEDANDEYFTRTNASGTNDKTFTVSFWFKRTKLGGVQELWDGGVFSEATRIGFGLSSDELWLDIGKSSRYRSSTTQQFRDTSAWYHIVWKVDTTQSTEADRFRVYVNGAEITDWASRQYPTQNFDTSVASGLLARIGSYDATYHGSSGYMAEFNYLDGLAVAPTEFGEYDDDSGIWIPKQYTGSYPGQSAYLDFKDGANLGANAKGDDANWTEVNLAAADQAVDTPTNNFCTLNPVYQAQGTKYHTVSNGGTFVTGNQSGTAWDGVAATIPLFKGKWYWEIKKNGAAAATNMLVGVGGIDEHLYNWRTLTTITTGAKLLFSYNGGFYANAEGGGFAYDDGDIISIALDQDNGGFYLRKNGAAWTNSGDPASGSNLTGAQTTPWGTSIPAFNVANNVGGLQLNFGGFDGFTVSSGNADANGYGNFEYAPPSGYYAICTKNLAEYG